MVRRLIEWYHGLFHLAQATIHDRWVKRLRLIAFLAATSIATQIVLHGALDSVGLGSLLPSSIITISHRVGRLACGVSGDVAADAGRRRGDGGEEGICVRPSRDPQASFSPSRQGRGPRIRSTAYPRGCDASIGVASVADNHRSASLRPRRLPLHARARPASGSPLAGE